MRIRVIAVVSVVALGLLAGCSSSDDSGGGGSTSSTAPKAQTLHILVSNDDGYSADGIDAVVEALRKLPDVEITVSAPADDKSGTGSQTTPGTLTATDQKTKSGYPATAVNGFPADSVAYGLANVVKQKPQLVVTGINHGPNLGRVAGISGTVGAAKTGVAQGIPAIAASQGLGDNIEYTTAAQYVVDWVTAHRMQLLDGDAEVDVVNLNVPTCPSGKVRGIKQVPLATGGNANPTVDCNSTTTQVADDIAAFAAGFAPVTQLDAQGQTVTSSTTWPAPG